jgi:hypothetical protein
MGRSLVLAVWLLAKTACTFLLHTGKCRQQILYLRRLLTCSVGFCWLLWCRLELRLLATNCAGVGNLLLSISDLLLGSARWNLLLWPAIRLRLTGCSVLPPEEDLMFRPDLLLADLSAADVISTVN